jgi:hypothetical protein
MSPRTQTAAELLTAKREKMPAELADLHFQLGQDLSWLHIDWIEFKKIFAVSDRRVALLNATAGRAGLRTRNTDRSRTGMCCAIGESRSNTAVDSPPRTARRSALSRVLSSAMRACFMVISD